MHIITHRGLDPSLPNYYLESSFEAFENQLTRGFGLEFDLQLTKDNEIIVLHDKDLNRLSKGKYNTTVGDLDLEKLMSLEFDDGHLISLSGLLSLIENKGSQDALHAIHIKHFWHIPLFLDILLQNLKGIDHKRFILFDLTPNAAEYIKSKNKSISLASSVSHLFDIERYNKNIGGTLLTVEEALAHRKLFDWIWLDEWDRRDKDNRTKNLYTKEIFDKFHRSGMKIALVTPELHRTSPGISGESHEDAINMEKLKKRLKEIISLNPDALCTDYPDIIRQLIKNKTS